jgi:putative ABC transport system substrate-binding protein
MRRREVLGLVCALSTWPLAASAQQSRVPVLGLLTTRSRDEASAHTAAFLRGLGEKGYVADQNVLVEYRWASGDYNLLPTFARELVSRRVALIVAAGDPSAVAAKNAAGAIPVVFIMGDDPVRLGLVSSFNRPGGNATGVSLLTNALGAKRLGLLCELLPGSGAVALLVNRTNPSADAHIAEVQEAATTLGRALVVLRASDEADLEESFAILAREHAVGLVVHNDPFFDTRRDQIIGLAAQHRVPAIYHIREFPQSSGLMSYGPSLLDSYHEIGVQAGQILDGRSPGSIPVMQPSRFEFVINVRTAKALGLLVPETMLLRADEMIE